MIPSSLTAWAVFALVVVPGLVFNSVRARKEVAGHRTTFETISHIAVVGLVIAGSSAALVAIVSYLWPWPFVDLSDWVANGNEYWRQNPYRVLVTIGVIGALSILLGVVAALLTLHPRFGSLLAKRLGERQVSVGSAWTSALRAESRAEIVSVTAHLSDGEVLTGRVIAFDEGDSLNPQCSGLSLVAPMYVGHKPIVDCEMLLLAYREITHMTVQISTPAAHE